MFTGEPVPVTSHWQLFVDDYVVGRSTGLDRVVHHPKAKGVVIAADRPWETAGAAPVHIHRDKDGTFQAFYNAMWWNPSEGSDHAAFKVDRAHHISAAVALATSADGVRWEKPSLRLVEGPAEVDRSAAPFPQPKGSTRENNLGVPFNFVADLGQWGNVADPARRYALRLAPKADAGFRIGSNWDLAPKGYFAAAIPDFRNDPRWMDKLVDSGSQFNPRRKMLHFWDDVHREWVTIEQGVVGHWLPTREIARFGSKDLQSWTAEACLYPDAADPHRQDRYDEPMHMTPLHTEGVVLGLLAWFHSDRTHPEGGPILRDPAQPGGHPDHWPFCRKGFGGTRITTSRDGGKTWDRTSSREDWIPHGTEQDSYDRIAWCGPTPVRVGDEDWFYATCISGDHLGIRANREQSSYYRHRLQTQQVGLYVQKRNRYVSLTARNFVEVLISKPVTLEGETLEVNADASRGRIRVGIGSAEPMSLFDGRAAGAAPHLLSSRGLIEGFGFDDCVPIEADGIEQKVAFKGGRRIAELRGRPVYLLFEMVDADLYGFRTV